MTPITPSKPWRVIWPSLITADSNSEDYRSQRAAYDAAASITRVVTATVYHWVSGVWVLYERVDPLPPHPEEETGK